MIDDPYTYDLSEFATEFTWGLLFWNLAETQSRSILTWLLGNELPAMAIVADMKNRSILQGIEAAGRELDDTELRDHLAHFCKGFGALLGYRNQYVHGLTAVHLGDTVGLNRKLVGQVMAMKSEGRLRVTNRTVPMDEIRNFVAHTKALSQYGSALKTALGMDDFGVAEILGMPPPSLEKPVWPSALQNTPSYLQE